MADLAGADRLVPIVLGLVGAADGDAEVGGLFLRELRQLRPDLLEVQAGDLLVEVLRQAVDVHLVAGAVLPQVELRERLVGEAVLHNERRVAGGATEIHEAAFG